MLNKRKALIGYAVYAVTKPIAKRKIKSKAGFKSRRSKLVAAVGALGAAAGALLLRRRKNRTHESVTP
jgi:hypothetical protein